MSVQSIRGYLVLFMKKSTSLYVQWLEKNGDKCTSLKTLYFVLEFERIFSKSEFCEMCIVETICKSLEEI